ncbi:MAG: aminotransferase class V-fold PLP-dependent enzyme [Bacteroidota bacterium]
MDQPLTCQRDLFTLDEGDIYINCAYMSPQLKSVRAAGVHGIDQKNRPTQLPPAHFFRPVQEARELFAQLINADDYRRISIMPSTSYGMATAANNIHLARHEKIVMPGGQFPSNYYSWKGLADRSGGSLDIIVSPDSGPTKTKDWNGELLQAIDQSTKVVTISHTHWSDGTRWNLDAIRERTSNVGALLIIDGTQSIGALPFDVQRCKPDAVIASCYKWLMGPYSIALGYFGPAFDQGAPIEENWMNRVGSDNFRALLNYQEEYRPMAGRYMMGEQSQFVNIPMTITALQQLLAWQPHRIQDYCEFLWLSIKDDLDELGIQLPIDRAHHLIGLTLPEGTDIELLQKSLREHNISVSFRGDIMRVSPHLYNRVSDMRALVEVIKEVSLQMA